MPLSRRQFAGAGSMAGVMYTGSGVRFHIPTFVCLWTLTLRRISRADLLPDLNSLDNWRFTEWFHGKTLESKGMAGQSWNAATFLLARRMVEGAARQSRARPWQRRRSAKPLRVALTRSTPVNGLAAFPRLRGAVASLPAGSRASLLKKLPQEG